LPADEIAKEENGKREEKDVNEAKGQERQEISIGRKSKSVGGRGLISGWEGGILWGSHQLYISRDGTRYQRNNNLITLDVPTYTLYTLRFH